MKGRTTRGRAPPVLGTALALLGLVGTLLAASAPVAAGGPEAAPPKFLMIVHESGLPAGQPWSLIVVSSTDHGAPVHTTNATYSELEEPGLVTVTILDVGAYQPNESTHQFSIVDRSVTWNFTFVHNGTLISGFNGTNTTSSGLTTDEIAFFVVVAVAAVAASVLVYRRRRPPKKEAPDEAAAGAAVGPRARKRSDPDEEEEEDGGSEAAARRRARRERREGAKRDRAKRPRPAPVPGGSGAPDDTDPDES